MLSKPESASLKHMLGKGKEDVETLTTDVEQKSI